MKDVKKMNLKMFSGWDEVLKEGGGSSTKTDFTKLGNGITELRFLDDEPFVRWAHWLNNCKRNISCIGANCPVCESIRASKQAGIKSPYSSNRKFAMHVYNFNTGKSEILEQGKNFFAQLHALHEEIGDIRNYNVKVKTQNAGSTDVMHTLIPVAPSELPEDVLENVKELKPFDEIFKKPTREQIIDLMAGKSPEEVFGNKQETNEDDEQVGI